MIILSFFKTPPLLIKAEGHALFAPKNNDLVCCAVSVLIQSWYISVIELCKADISLNQEKDWVEYKLNNGSRDISLFFDALLINCLRLEKQYPEYIQVKVEEYNGS